MTFLSSDLLNKNSNLIKFILFALVLLFFWVKGAISLDPDFGWHLRVGQILDQGIPRTDPFSYTMPSYPFVNHEWLTDVVIAKVYPLIGLPGLSFIFAGIAILALLITFSNVSKQYMLGPILLSTTILLPFTGIRPQIISWLFFAILVKLILNQTLWQKWKITLPLLFFVWANLHGGFLLGIFILGLFIVFKLIQSQKIIIFDLFLLLTCIVFTLINPYSFNLWQEILKSVFDSSLRWTIVEWAPPIIFRIDFAYILFTTLSSFLIIRYHKKFTFFHLTAYFILLFAGLTSQRNIPFFILFSAYFLVSAIKFLYQEVAHIKYGTKRLQIALNLLIFICLVLFILQNGSNLYSIYTFKSENFYPYKAVEWIKLRSIKGQIFAPYNWGGFLIWQLPQKKVFVDGRMPSWKLQCTDKSQSENAYKDYRNLLSGQKDLKETLKKYNIKTVLWMTDPKQEEKPLNKKLQSWGLGFLVNIVNSPKASSFTQRIKELGWVKVYEDRIAVIYQKD